MRCPFCSNEETQVRDSRPSEDQSAIRRRRACSECGSRFTTYERVQLREMTVIKNDGRKQSFDRDKIMRSMQIALQKRPVSQEQMEVCVNQIVRRLEGLGDGDITTDQIGAEVMAALKGMDTVGYIRYASVYKDFRDPDDFNAFVDDIKRLRA